MCRAKKLYAIGIEPWSWRSDTTIWRHNQGKKTWDSRSQLVILYLRGLSRKQVSMIKCDSLNGKLSFKQRHSTFEVLWRKLQIISNVQVKCWWSKSNIRKVMWEGQLMKLNFWAGITALECQNVWLLPTNQHCLSSHLETSDTKLCWSNINKMHKECARTLPVNSYLPTLDCFFTEDN